MNNNLEKSFDDVLTVLVNLNSKKEMFYFFKDLLTEKEILEFSKRLEVAKLLDNKIPYTKIEEKTSMSSKTIARVSKFLNWKNFWYKKALSILKSVSEKHHIDHQS